MNKGLRKGVDVGSIDLRLEDPVTKWTSPRFARLVPTLLVCVALAWAALASEGRGAEAPRLLITEIAAANDDVLPDYEGHFSDWIEIYSMADGPVDLKGWYLTDSPNNLRKWAFPAVTVAPGEFRIVFASGKDRVDPARELHTNFKLQSDGEYLALVLPDGETVVSAFDPNYPVQVDDVAYGVEFGTRYLLETGAEMAVYVPTDDALGLAWTAEDYEPGAGWLTAPSGVGYGIADVEVAGELLVDLEANDMTSGTPVLLWRNGGKMQNFVAGDSAPRVGMVGGVPAVTFDGKATYLRSRDYVPDAITGNSDWSVEVWVFNPEIALSETLVNWAKISKPFNGAALNYGSAPGYGAVSHSSGDLGYAGGLPTTATWHHIAVTYSGGENGLERLYVDGVLNTSQTRTLRLHGPSQDEEQFPVLIGTLSENASLAGLKSFLSGSIAAVRMHTGELAPEQVANNFSAHAAYFGVQADSSARASSKQIGLDSEALMRGKNASIYVRIPFDVADTSQIDMLGLRMRYNDGFVAYLNGAEVARRHAPEALAWNASATEALPGWAGQRAEFVGLSAASVGLLKPGRNVLAIHGLNASVDSEDFRILPELLATKVGEGACGFLDEPTPGAFNTTATVSIRADHSPGQPASGEPIVVTAQVNHVTGVGGVELRYQIVAPGVYISSHFPLPHSTLVSAPDTPFDPNPAFEDPANWTAVAMLDDGSGEDAAADDGVYTAVIPGQPNRTLVRYRVTASDGRGALSIVPHEGDPSLNYACFVYDGVPEYATTKASVHPEGAGHVYSKDLMNSLPVYMLITDPDDLLHCVAWDTTYQIPADSLEGRSSFNWEGAFFYDGKVYDHIHYRLRQRNDRYGLEGKRSMRFRFNKGRYCQFYDNYGKPYPEKWRTLNTGKMFDNRRFNNFGLTEPINHYLCNLVGSQAAWMHLFHFRVVDGPDEAPAGDNGQYFGDFWGMAVAVEDYDTQYISSHNLPDGNLYKLKNGIFNGNDVKRHQGLYSTTGDEDFQNIRLNLLPDKSEEWLRRYVNWEQWYRYHTVVEAIRHYDVQPSDGWLKNRAWLFEYHKELPLGLLRTFMHDSDASWGPNWNEGVDYEMNTISAGTGKPVFLQEYRNTIREFRDLMWTEEAMYAMIDDQAAWITEFSKADRDRWTNAPAAAGTLNVGPIYTVEGKVEDMKNFAFVGWQYTGEPEVGPGGRAAYLDSLADAGGDNLNIPYTPAVSKVNAPTVDLVGPGAEAQVLVPSDGSLGADWTQADFEPGEGWVTGRMGVGFNVPEIAVAGELLVDLDAESLTSGAIVSKWPNAGTMGDFYAYGTMPKASHVGGATGVAFDGADDWLHTKDMTPPEITDNASWSAEVWAYNPDIASRETMLTWTRFEGRGARTMLLNYGTASSDGALSHWGDSDRPYAGGPPASGAWHHIAVTYSGGTDGIERLYVDGEINTTQTKTFHLHGVHDENPFPIILGAASPNTALSERVGFFSGLLAQVRVHTGELTREQVVNNFRADAPHFGFSMDPYRAFESSYVRTNVESAMLGVNASAYARIRFDVADPQQFESMALRMRYNDGFIAYLNGVKVAERNAPASPVWNSASAAAHGGRYNLAPEFINLSARLDLLRPSGNVLAIHGLNRSADDPDFLIDPELEASVTSLASQESFPINSLLFQTTPFRDPQGDNTFAAMKWRVGEITDPLHADFDRTERRKYEITAVYESPELDTFAETLRVPISAIEKDHVYRVRVKMKDSSGRWSHWSEPLEFRAGERDDAEPLAAHLRITEIMYHPAEDEGLEYIELFNTSADATLDLSGVALTQGVTFTFPDGATLAPGAYLVLVRADPRDNFAYFRNAYGLDESVAIYGPYEGKLANGGELLSLNTVAGGSVILSFEYGDRDGWPRLADGGGPSLELIDPFGTPPEDYGNGERWRASPKDGGTPGNMKMPRQPASHWILY